MGSLVGGLMGVGIFLLLFIGGLSLLICVIGNATQKPFYFYVTSTLMMGLTLLILFTAEISPPPDNSTVGNNDYNRGYYMVSMIESLESSLRFLL